MAFDLHEDSVLHHSRPASCMIEWLLFFLPRTSAILRTSISWTGGEGNFSTLTLMRYNLDKGEGTHWSVYGGIGNPSDRW